MTYIVTSFWIIGVTFLASGRDIFLSTGFLLVAILMTMKCCHIKKTSLTSPHWSDAISGRVISCVLLMAFFLSMLAFYYRYKYQGYGMSETDFENMWLYYWDVLNFDYPNDVNNLCFISKTLAMTFGGLTLLFAVIDRKITARKRQLGIYPFDCEDDYM